MSRGLVLVIVVGAHALAMQALAGNHKNTLRGATSSYNGDGVERSGSGSLVIHPLGDGSQLRAPGTEPDAAPTTTTATGGTDGRSGGNQVQKGGPVVSFGGERPVFNDPSATEVGPRNCFTDANGKPVNASDIANGLIPAGTTLKMVAPSGRSVDVTVEPLSEVATIAAQSSNYKYPQVSLDQVRGGAATKGVFGVRPVIGTALSFVGVENVADMDYYAGTPGMLDAMREGGLNAGPDVYLVLASAPAPAKAAQKDKDLVANVASQDGAAALSQSGTARGMRGAVGRQSSLRSNLVASSGGGANANAVGCGNIIGGGGGGGGGGGKGGATPNAPNK